MSIIIIKDDNFFNVFPKNDYFITSTLDKNARLEEYYFVREGIAISIKSIIVNDFLNLLYIRRSRFSFIYFHLF